MRVRLVHLSAGSCDQCTKRGREQLPHVWGQGQKPGGPHAWRAVAKRSYPTSEVRGGDERSYPTSEARGGGLEEQLHVQRAMAARAQEKLEELSHSEGQEVGQWGDTPRPR